MIFFIIYQSIVFFILGTIVPYIFLKDMFEQDGLGVLLMVGIILVVWFIISFIIKTKNKYIIQKNKVNEIYIRDIESDYSPAVLSYLMNNKIETSKDLPATLLNLCAKNILKIENVENKIKIIDLKNNKEVKKLKDDEQYAYKMFTSGVSNQKVKIWKNKVLSEYKKYKYSISNKKSLGVYLACLYVTLFVGIMLYFIITGASEITGIPAEILSRLLIGTFMATWEMLLFTGFKELLNGGLLNKKTEFREIYTSAGAREYSKWKKFESFIQDFSIIKEREYKSIVIWGKYLSYSIALGINKKCDRELYEKIGKEYSFDFDLLSEIYNYENEEK